MGSLASVLALLLAACDGGSPGGADAGAGGPDGAAGAVEVASGDTASTGNGRWESAAGLPLARFYVGVGAARDKVFVIGGYRNNQPMTAGHFYDIKTATWFETAPLPSRMWMANVAGVGDRLFVLAARENTTALEYNFDNNTWIPRAPMPEERGRGSAAVGVHGNLVLVAGGVTDGVSDNNLATGRRKSDFYAYDTSKDTWQKLPLMPFDNGYAMGAVVGTQFWVVGGSTNVSRTDQVLVYDLVKGMWETRGPPPKSISSAASGALGTRMIVAGGIATSMGRISPDTMVLDTVTGVWSTAAPLPTARFAMGGAVVGSKLYVPTGLAVSPTNPDAFVELPVMEIFSF